MSTFDAPLHEQPRRATLARAPNSSREGSLSLHLPVPSFSPQSGNTPGAAPAPSQGASDGKQSAMPGSGHCHGLPQPATPRFSWDTNAAVDVDGELDLLLGALPVQGATMTAARATLSELPGSSSRKSAATSMRTCVTPPVLKNAQRATSRNHHAKVETPSSLGLQPKLPVAVDSETQTPIAFNVGTQTSTLSNHNRAEAHLPASHLADEHADPAARMATHPELLWQRLERERLHAELLGREHQTGNDVMEEWIKRELQRKLRECNTELFEEIIRKRLDIERSRCLHQEFKAEKKSLEKAVAVERRFIKAERRSREEQQDISARGLEEELRSARHVSEGRRLDVELREELLQEQYREGERLWMWTEEMQELAEKRRLDDERFRTEEQHLQAERRRLDLWSYQLEEQSQEQTQKEQERTMEMRRLEDEQHKQKVEDKI